MFQSYRRTDSVRPLAAALLAAVIIAGVGPYAAADTEEAVTAETGSEVFAGWTASSFTVVGLPECFVMGPPEPRSRSQPPGWDPSITVTHRPADGVFNEITIDPGILLDPSQPAAAAVGDHAFTLLVDSMSQRLMLPTDREEEEGVVAAMRSGSLMEVTATTVDGHAILDRYDLTGFGQAMDWIDMHCAR